MIYPEGEIIFQTRSKKDFMEMSHRMKIIFEELRTDKHGNGTFRNKGFDKGSFFHCNGEIDFFDSTDIKEEPVGITRVTLQGIERREEPFQSFGIFFENRIVHVYNCVQSVQRGEIF